MKKTFFILVLLWVASMVFAQDYYIDYNDNQAYDNYGQSYYEVDDDDYIVEYDDEDKSSLPTKYQLLPSGYDTPGRDKGEYRTAWAFAITGAIESAYLMKYNPSDYLLFSPLNIINKNRYAVGIDNEPIKETGNDKKFISYLFNLTGPVLEDSDPYISPYTSPATQPASYGAVENLYFLSNGLQGFDEAVINNIKNNVYNRGGVKVSMYYKDNGLWFSADKKSFNSKYTETNPNHAVIIVGWDDNYSKDNFSTPPSKNGAFQVKDCRGATAYGSDPYFWISYKDLNLSRAIGLEYAKPYDVTYNKILTHIKNAGTDFIAAKKGKVIFTPEKNGILRGVKTYIASAGATVSVSVSKSPSFVGGATATASFVPKYEGFYTVKFDKAYEYKKGDKLTLIINYNYNNESDKSRIPVEENSDKSFPVTKKAGINYYSEDGNSWTDFYNHKGTNLAAGLAVTEIEEVTKIKLNKNTADLAMGNYFVLKATCTPANATYPTVSFSSSNSKVVKVKYIDGQSTKVTAVAPGEATITAYYDRDSGVSATCKVVVVDKIPVEGVELSHGTLTLYEGQTGDVTAKVLPTNATNKKLTWRSADTSIAKVEYSGNGDKVTVKAVKAGETKILATVTDWTTKDQYGVKIVVKKKVAPTSISLSPTSMSVQRGKTKVITATVLPDNATNKEVIWTSSDESVAKVELVQIKKKMTHVVKGVKGGSAIITATSADNSKVKATCKVSVFVPAQSVTISPTSTTMNVGDKKTVKATVKPSDATNKACLFSSSNTNVASVSYAGTITAKAPGSAIITATTKNGGYTASCAVTVKDNVIHVTGVTLDQTKLTMKKGANVYLGATVIPENATNQDVTWSSSDESVAYVNSKGKVSAYKGGEAVITVKTKDGGYTATCNVTVDVKATGVTLDKTEITMKKGANKTLVATVLPEDATNKEVTWSSSDKEIAYVNSKGKVSAYKAGEATITCKTKDGGYKATCKVTVIVPVTGVSLNYTSIQLDPQNLTKTLKATVTPEDATNKDVTWKSSATSVATVSSSGKVTAKGVGIAVITCTTKDGGYTATCEVNVPYW